MAGGTHPPPPVPGKKYFLRRDHAANESWRQPREPASTSAMPTDPTADLTKEQAAAYNKALQRIEACRKSGGTKLNLSDLGLTALPPETLQRTCS